MARFSGSPLATGLLAACNLAEAAAGTAPFARKQARRHAASGSLPRPLLAFRHLTTSLDQSAVAGRPAERPGEGAPFPADERQDVQSTWRKTMVGAVIVVHFGELAPTLRLLTALAGTQLHRVVVANDKSDAPKHAALDGVDWIPLPNPGYATAINVAVRRVAERGIGRVLVCNNDVEVNPGNALGLIQAASGDGIHVPQLVNGESQVSVFGLRLDRFARPRLITTAGERPTLAYGAVFAARTSYMEAHPLPEHFFLYYEDVAWSFGKPIHVVPEIKFRHLEGGTTSTDRGRGPIYAYYNARNRLIWLREAGLARHATSLVGTCLELVKWWREGEKTFAYVSALGRGIRDGMRKEYNVKTKGE
jgi:GT2 family glycosyltransferase